MLDGLQGIFDLEDAALGGATSLDLNQFSVAVMGITELEKRTR